MRGKLTSYMKLELCLRHIQRMAGLGAVCAVLASCSGLVKSGPVSWVTPAAITYGTALSVTQLDAVANVPGTLAYTPSLGTILPAGTHTLSAILTPSDGSPSVTVSVTLTVNQALPVLSWASPAAITYGTALSAAQLNATANLPGVFTYSPALGSVPSAGSDKLSVTFIPTDSNYATFSASVALTVNQVVSVLSWTNPAPITYGTPLSATQLNATASVPGAFAYTPALGSIVPAGSHTLSVTFTPSDATDYTTVSTSVTLAVSQATPQITWATPAAITYGTALSVMQLNATASIPGAFSYTPSLGALPSVGTLVLSVTFTPNDATDYTTAASSVTLKVNQAVPQISWNPAALIAVGSPIGSGQLNATATAPGSSTPLSGSFIYSPPAGTVFNSPGPQTLSVAFTPADTLDYATPPPATINMTVSSFGVAAWGDSLTFGNQGSYDRGDFPDELKSLITLPVVNEGVSGNTSTQIGVRQGGVPTYATVTGGIIPASGGVTVTFPAGYEPVTSVGPKGGTPGTILGVHGVVTLDSTGTIFTFTRSTAGSSENAPGNPQFVVDTPYANYIPVFWEGRNNYSSTVQIISDLAAQVATVPAGQNYLVLDVTPDNNPKEWPGGVEYPYLLADKAQMEATYGSHYLDIWGVLVNSYNPDLITDVSDYNHNEVPTSLRAIAVYTTLQYAIGPADTTLTVACNVWCVVGVGALLTIDSGGANAENVQVTKVNGSVLTVQRTVGGVNVAHVSGAPVTMTDIVHLNGTGEQIVANAIAKYLSAYAK